MPRVPGRHHLGRRDLLVVRWHHIPDLISLHPPAAQWERHRFYAPSQALTDAEFLAHDKTAYTIAVLTVFGSRRSTRPIAFNDKPCA